MDIFLQQLSKRFNRDWIFRDINFHFQSGQSYAITGNNGSGKSTLLQCIAGAIQTSRGTCNWQQEGKNIPEEDIHRYFSLAAPYLDIVEEMTPLEFLQFHREFKPLLPGLTLLQILEAVQLKEAAHKQIRFFSSGMKQRIKLAQALFSDMPVLLLDEPCTNLDASGYALYQQLMEKYCLERTVIISSNDPQEYGFCKEIIDIRRYK